MVAVTPRRVNVLGVGVSAVTMADALAQIDQWIATDAREYVCVTGVHGVMESHVDLRLRDIHNQAGLVTPDGMPLIGRARGEGHVWLATGHQMTGLKTGTGTGLLIAQLMAGETPRFDPEPFRADRY